MHLTGLSSGEPWSHNVVTGTSFLVTLQQQPCRFKQRKYGLAVHGGSRRCLTESRGFTFNKAAGLKTPLMCGSSWALTLSLFLKPRENSFRCLSLNLPTLLQRKRHWLPNCWVTALGFCSKVQPIWIRAQLSIRASRLLALYGCESGWQQLPCMATFLNSSHHLNLLVIKMSNG